MAYIQNLLKDIGFVLCIGEPRCSHEETTCVYCKLAWINWACESIVGTKCLFEHNEVPLPEKLGETREQRVAQYYRAVIPRSSRIFRKRG